MDLPASVCVEQNLENLRQELNNKLMFLRNKNSQNSIGASLPPSLLAGGRGRNSLIYTGPEGKPAR